MRRVYHVGKMSRREILKFHFGHLTRATLQGHRRVRHVGKVGLTRSICEQRQPFGSITIEQGDGGAGCSTGDRQRLNPRAERQACCGIDARASCSRAKACLR